MQCRKTDLEKQGGEIKNEKKKDLEALRIKTGNEYIQKMKENEEQPIVLICLT